MADGNLVGGLAGAVASVVNTAIESRTAKQNTDKTNAANRALAEYQYSKDLEMWNRGNAYNAPQAQMERLKNAGLNPNMVYGNGSPQGATAMQLPKYNAPTMQYNYRPPVNPLAMLEQYQDLSIKQAQIDNLRAQRDAIEGHTYLMKDQGTLTRTKQYQEAIRTGMLDLQMEQFKKTAPYQLNQLQNTVKQQELGMSFTRSNTAKTNSQNMLIQQQTRLQENINNFFLTKFLSGVGLNLLKLFK